MEEALGNSICSGLRRYTRATRFMLFQPREAARELMHAVEDERLPLAEPVYVYPRLRYTQSAAAALIFKIKLHPCVSL